MLMKGFNMDDSIAFFNWPGFSASPDLNPLYRNASLLPRCRSGAEKTSGKCGCGRKSFDSGSQTSAMELALAKPMKHSNKFVVKSSRLRVAEKATAATIKIARKKKMMPSRVGAARSGLRRVC
jgi:hypothetical protein